MDNLNYDEEENYSDIQPAKFYNEKDFNKELDEVMLITKDNTADWKKRESALKKLGGIFLSSYGSTTTFIKLFNQKIYLNLSVQMLDLRSSLMKEACRITALASKTYGIKIETAAERLISSLVLYKLVNSANKLISDTGSICITQIIKNVDSVKIISRIHEQMKNKSNTVRVRACQHLLIVLNHYNNSTLNKSARLIEDFISSTTHDANMDVRMNARKVYYRYMELFPNMADKLFSTFEHHVQKTISEEYGNNEGYNGGNPLNGGNNLNSSNHSRMNSRKISENIDDLCGNSSYRTNTNNKNTAINNSNGKNKLGKPSDIQSLTNYNSYNLNEFKNLAASVKYGNTLNKMRMSDAHEFNNERVSLTNPMKTNMLNTTIADHMEIKPFSKTEKKDVLTKLNSMKLGTSSSLSGTVTNTYATNTNIPIQIKKKISINKIRSMTDNLFDHQDFIKSSTQISTVHKKRNSINPQSISQYLQEKPKYKNVEELIKIKINSILNAQKANDLRLKFCAFEEISSYFNEIYSNYEYISKPILKNLMSLHISNLADDSNKLIVQIMKNLTKFIFYMDDIFTEEDIHNITKIIIFNISSDIEDISQNATALFEIIRKKLDSNIVIKPLIEIIQKDTTEFVILEICFEFVNPIIDLAVMTLSDQNYLTNFVINMAKILQRLEEHSDSNKNVRDLMYKVLDCNELIFKKYPKQFLKCFKSDKFPQELRSFLINLFTKCNKQNMTEYIYQNTENYSNYNSHANTVNQTTDSIKTNSINYYSNSFSSNPSSRDAYNSTNLVKPQLTNLNVNNYYTSSQNGFNYDENFNLTKVNYDVLKIAYETKLTSFVDYLHSDPNSNTENFLLALNKIKYEQVFFILNHIYFILDSEEHKNLFADNFSMFINRIIYLLDKFYSEYSEQIKEIINLIPAKLDKEIFLQLIPKYITNRQSPHIVQILLLSINSVIHQIDQENLLLLLPSFIETVFNTLNHHISDVRKYAVYCIVDLYLILGKDFDGYLNELNASQRNLINIYVRKKLENSNH